MKSSSKQDEGPRICEGAFICSERCAKLPSLSSSLFAVEKIGRFGNRNVLERREVNDLPGRTETRSERPSKLVERQERLRDSIGSRDTERQNVALSHVDA